MKTPPTDNPILVYLSGPISARDGYAVEDNVTVALKVYLWCVQYGIPTMCPHLSAIFPSAWTDVTYEQWMDFDYRVIAHCTDMVMLNRWETSPGAVKEKAFAESIGVRVHTSWVEWAADYAAEQLHAPPIGPPICAPVAVQSTRRSRTGEIRDNRKA